ncbi:MAG TPA: DNA replication complex GINS family protein [Candidatus Altiarchaeales archaeon]|nr:DNA replication complex GINS family protein [Candidatus Altiarchaeales archaeon]
MSFTYNDVESIYRLEKRSSALQKINDNFYSELHELICKVGDEYRDNLLRIRDELFTLRMSKILRLVARPGESSPPSNMTRREKEIYDDIKSIISNYMDEISRGNEPCKTTEKEDEKGQKIPRLKIRILRSIPAIIGSDMKHYGPFYENDEVELPEETAKILLEQEIAKRIS